MEQIAVLNAKDHFLPKFAIIGYEREDENYRNNHYFSYHEVAGTKLTAGMPLTKDTARNIFTCLEGDLIKFRFKGMLPENLIHFDFKGNFQLLWYVHTKQRMLYFDTKTGIQSGKYPLPKLLFKLEGNSLKVFALNRKDTLMDDTPLYHAPLLNIGSHGNVCMGNASMDYDGFEYYEDVMGFVEQQFFRSVFTETHHNNLVDGNIVNVMKQNFEKPLFNDEVLIANKMTLNQLYEN
jgi:PRTRC genetic system protein B